MYAEKLANESLGAFFGEVSEIIKPGYWINQKNVNSYFLEKGGAKDIMQRKEVLIDKDYIDSVSGIINDDFDRLLDIELKLEKQS